jgi:predicted transcriptional regulator
VGRKYLFVPTPNPRCREAMAKARGIDFDNPAPIDEEEDEETLAAIDEGIRDAEAGRTVPIEEVRALLPQWITTSSSGKER